MSEFIRYTRDGRIGTITIDRPAKKNAMTYAMLGDFIAAVHEAGQDESTAVLARSHQVAPLASGGIRSAR